MDVSVLISFLPFRRFTLFFCHGFFFCFYLILYFFNSFLFLLFFTLLYFLFSFFIYFCLLFCLLFLFVVCCFCLLFVVCCFCLLFVVFVCCFCLLFLLFLLIFYYYVSIYIPFSFLIFLEIGRVVLSLIFHYFFITLSKSTDKLQLVFIFKCFSKKQFDFAGWRGSFVELIASVFLFFKSRHIFPCAFEFAAERQFSEFFRNIGMDGGRFYIFINR